MRCADGWRFSEALHEATRGTKGYAQALAAYRKHLASCAVCRGWIDQVERETVGVVHEWHDDEEGE